MLLGSVSQHVASHASCTVVVVRDQQTALEQGGIVLAADEPAIYARSAGFTLRWKVCRYGVRRSVPPRRSW
jgi:hypothetical protein